MAFCNQSVASNTIMIGDVALLNLTRIDVKLLFSFMIGHFDERIPRSLGIPGWLCQGSISLGIISRMDTAPALFRTHFANKSAPFSDMPPC
jgi:hypothetical protein